MSLFEQPNLEEGKADAEREAAKKGLGLKWTERTWKPKPDKNEIRILPARAASGAAYHLKVAKHFIRHADRTEAFICLREVFAKPCPACEENARLYRLGEKDQAQKYRAQRVGVFNVLDCSEKELRVLIYEAPISVWTAILTLAADEGLFDVFDKDGNISKPGRSLVIKYYPKNHPQHKYFVFPGERSPLGTPEQLKAIHEKIIDLKVDVLYPPGDYDIAKIKTFGSKEEREALRQMLQEMTSGGKKAEEPASEVAEAEEVIELGEAAEPEGTGDGGEFPPAEEEDEPAPVAEPEKPAEKPAAVASGQGSTEEAKKAPKTAEKQAKPAASPPVAEPAPAAKPAEKAEAPLTISAATADKLAQIRARFAKGKK